MSVLSFLISVFIISYIFLSGCQVIILQCFCGVQCILFKADGDLYSAMGFKTDCIPYFFCQSLHQFRAQGAFMSPCGGFGHAHAVVRQLQFVDYGAAALQGYALFSPLLQPGFPVFICKVHFQRMVV